MSSELVVQVLKSEKHPPIVVRFCPYTQIPSIFHFSSSSSSSCLFSFPSSISHYYFFLTCLIQSILYIHYTTLIHTTRIYTYIISSNTYVPLNQKQAPFRFTSISLRSTKWEVRALPSALSSPPSNPTFHRTTPPPLGLLRRLRRRFRWRRRTIGSPIRMWMGLIRTFCALFACRSSRMPFSLLVDIVSATCVLSRISRIRAIVLAALIFSPLVISTLISFSIRFTFSLQFYSSHHFEFCSCQCLLTGLLFIFVWWIVWGIGFCVFNLCDQYLQTIMPWFSVNCNVLSSLLILNFQKELVVCLGIN